MMIQDAITHCQTLIDSQCEAVNTADALRVLVATARIYNCTLCVDGYRGLKPCPVCGEARRFLVAQENAQ